jgi:hypothetical protein
MPINEAALEAENQELNNFSDPTGSGEDTFRQLLKLMGRISPTALDREFDTQLKYGFFGTQSKNFEEKKAAAIRVFQGTDIERIAKLDSKYRGKIFGKIVNTGLFNLAFNAFPISEFGKERLYSVTAAKKGAADALDPTRDTAWLTQLTQVVRNISADPITLGVINSYFPSLVTFLFDAIAVTADYSSGGEVNGESEDSINNMKDFIASLEKAFGRGLNDSNQSFKEAVFTMSFNFENTAKRMKAVLDNSPYRENTQPTSPDVFHLRLGAANFFVPPLSIDVNTAFKTGSLTGGALRQKNTPKFNSGYKESSIRMRLFFPNYEEIWGISIDDASKIVLGNNYEIDFKSDGASDQKIDKFLSSLRGLVAAFKYSPFLPIRNQYLNTVHGITAVALSSMSISTVPNFPFALAVDIELMNFNHKPLLPMINDFNQAIHWGKYRQFMGKAAGALHSYVNESFLMKTTDEKASDTPAGTGTVTVGTGTYEVSPYGASLTKQAAYYDDILKTNIVSEWNDGKNISFYVPAETQTKIFLPDATSFRTDEERMLNDQSQDFWGKILSGFGIDLNESAGYGLNLSGVYNLSRNSGINPNIKYHLLTIMDILTAGLNDDSYRKKVYSYVATLFVKENSLSGAEQAYILDINSTNVPPETGAITYTFNSVDYEKKSLYQMKNFLKEISKTSKSLLDSQTKALADSQARKAGIAVPTAYANGTAAYKNLYDKIKDQIKNGFNLTLYERFFKSAPIEQLLEAARAKQGAFSFREWEVPMLKIDLDPAAAIVTGVSLTLGNNIAKLQLQMQDEPTYQHIGGKDTYINISMRIIGEKELTKLKRIFDHVNALARLEHSTGVIGFIGIKNIVTALSGVKYVLPSNFSVNTIPGFPHVYEVNISLIDFDVFQQTKEKLDSNQQRELIEHFSTKKNPFLRIKQMWGLFNAYPDLPLEIKNDKNEVVGHLDPDFYFRSFEMFDRDIINNISTAPKQLDIPNPNDNVGGKITESMHANVANEITNFLRIYPSSNSSNAAFQETRKEILNDVIYYIEKTGINFDQFISIFEKVIYNPNYFGLDNSDERSKIISLKKNLITDYLDYTKPKDSNTQDEFLNKVSSAPYQVGDINTGSSELLAELKAALAGKYSLKSEELVSFDPDELEFHHVITTYPIKDKDEPNKIPAIIQTALGSNLGYLDMEKDGRFYLTLDGVGVKKTENGAKIEPRGISDKHSDPSYSATQSAIAGSTAYANYQQPYSHGAGTAPETMTSSKPVDTVESHWEKMLVDTSYRDVSGRMLRAFPTYMLWLIDEGGYFAGVKLFDNFYGLQSIIDFSIIQSEDLLGDTLVFRVSNLYSKLSKKESASFFTADSEYSQDNPGITDGLSSVIDVTLNKARNILAHMKNDYIVDIENIRLKPGVRVHLRGGYGANPNSLQTLFNGVISQVELGEIVTVTAQSDAIELGAVVNSTNKKGDSGKIDGGINTGLWLSEPRDLMVRLLSMGASRFREGIAYANRGLVFSENKFGIRHFGSIVYEPLTVDEERKHQARIDAIADAYNSVGTGNASGLGKSALDIAVGTNEFRTPVFSLMNQLWSNFSQARDFEIFKRNIYPGNGTGIAQFLGGDLGDGWTSVSSITPSNQPNERIEYLSRLTDRSWNGLVQKYAEGDVDAKAPIEGLTSGGQIRDNAGSAAAGSAITISGLIGVSAVVGGPVGVVGALAGAGLLGVLTTRGGNNIFNMLGLTSSLDDDMPGFDEVSFRAQTYMRSVWDLFQTCARLLPNYIVAVRPFEDRSTVFYGKPHWLYTSGVVPVTTGYPGDEKMGELGISMGPKVVSPDFELSKIITEINKNSSSYADADAFLRNTEPTDEIAELTSLQRNSQGYYAASAALKGQLINFDSNRSKVLVDSKGKTVAKLPKTKGIVTMGFHLPVDNDTGGGLKTSSTSKIVYSTDPHSQIPQLPARFRFPLFTNRADTNGNYRLENYAFQYDSITGYSKVRRGLDMAEDALQFSIDISNPTAWAGKKIIGGIIGMFKDDNNQISSETNQDVYDSYLESIGSVYGDAFTGQLIADNVNIIERKLSPDQIADVTQNSYNFGGPIDMGSLQESLRVSMPLPDTGIFSKNNEINFTEWKMPKNSEDEQFYIAMRWPYKPNANETEVLKFAKKYFDSETNELIGTVEDYKNAHVLVYNPDTNSGVVCKPAYFLWGETKSQFLSEGVSGGTSEYNLDISEKTIDAVVSPDAAYFLGIISGDDVIFSDGRKKVFSKGKGYSDLPIPRECYFAFVPNTIPLGVATSAFVPGKKFSLLDDSDKELQDFLIGFGDFQSTEESLTARATAKLNSGYTGAGANPGGVQGFVPDRVDDYEKYRTNLSEYYSVAKLSDSSDFTYAGNYKDYYLNIFTNIDTVTSRDKGYDILDGEVATTGNPLSNSGRIQFKTVFSLADSISIEARKYYDEGYDLNVSVIAGDGRSLNTAQDIWDQFRFGYHTYSSVKTIFMDTFGFDPESQEDFSEDIMSILINGDASKGIFKKYKETLGSANDEFAILFGDEQAASRTAAIEFARKNFIDAPIAESGLIEYYDLMTLDKIKAFRQNFLIDNTEVLQELTGQTGDFIKNPQQLFLVMVGLFRQAMWSDPYARAWLVLKPSRKIGIGLGTAYGEDQWDFKSVDKIFAAFINPNNTYSKDKKKFLQLLYNNKGEGSTSSNFVTRVTSGIDNFWDRNIGPIFGAMGTALSGLVNMFKLNMLQTGYGLSQVGSLSKQANILNKALNDSIYYQLGRPGSLLRAVDNPFTREYGEPVVEIREAFQRIHYLSSFSHILSNQIQETTTNVSTVITAVSDGKYPVTVALDKGAPAERQMESTVETGIYFDNIVGSGFFGFLHPLLHPFETGRGLSKNLTGAPDELSAKRVALSHLKENVKDIYGGELLIIGNPDIRPHDIVYIADVYERMYGLFEVEQVIHHFTSELGFVTSITPNALVTVNDPAKWFMTSWIHSWMNMQAVRNDTRLFLDAVRADNSGITLGGDISIDRLAENLNPQMLGGIQYTHGSSALIKDVVASLTHSSFDSSTTFTDAIRKQAGINGNNGTVSGGTAAAAITGVVGGSAITGAVAGSALVGLSTLPIFGQLAWKGWQWVRDNLLDQHGCYVQYLNKNGQPMDAGLSYNQGMVVGRYHSKALLPGMLGLRRKTRTADGYTYIRSDDLFKALGWQETEIKELVRYISYENALVHAQVLNLSGLGPEKTTFEPFFKIFCKLDLTVGVENTGVIDADTIQVIDILSGAKIRVRFDGINAPEKSMVSSSYPNTEPSEAEIISKSSPGFRGTQFVMNALKNKVFLLRVKKSRETGGLANEADIENYEPGAGFNRETNYLKEIYGRTLATVFYNVSEEKLISLKDFVYGLFSSNKFNKSKIEKAFKDSFSDSVIYTKYQDIFNSIYYSTVVDHISNYPIANSEITNEELRKLFCAMVEMKRLEQIYKSASRWPMVLWDEYYDDGTPYTLNWELVANNLANVFTNDLLTESNSVNKAKDSVGIPTKVK